MRQNDGTVRCWGFGGDGRLGYCNTSNVGDNEAAKAITAGANHTCALLDNATAPFIRDAKSNPGLVPQV